MKTKTILIILIGLLAVTSLVFQACKKENDPPPPDNHAPELPSNPVPSDQSTDISINPLLEWECSDPDNDPLTYDIYFGTNNPPSIAETNQSGFTYDPGILSQSIQYYWKIVAKDNRGNQTEGVIWTFTITDNGQIIMEIGGKKFISVSINNFNNLSDTADWNLSPHGHLTIDTVNTFNGESSLKLVADGGCFIVEKIEGVNVDQDKVYVIHFHYEMEPVQIGDIVWCVGPCMIRLKQGDEDIFLDGVSGVIDWTEKYFYFQPENNIPVKIELLIGTERGVWLDDLIVLEEY